MKAQEIGEQKLEITVHSESNRRELSKFLSNLASILNWLFESIVKSNEPRIYISRDKFGNDSWRIYDPLAGHAAYFNSETEVRAWLDRRYYR